MNSLFYSISFIWKSIKPTYGKNNIIYRNWSTIGSELGAIETTLAPAGGHIPIANNTSNYEYRNTL